MPAPLATLSEQAARWLIAAAVAFASLGLCPCPASAAEAADAEAHECCETTERPAAPVDDDGCSHCEPSETPVRLSAADAAVERLVPAGSFPLPAVPFAGAGLVLGDASPAGRGGWPPVGPEAAPAETLRALHTLLLI